MKNASYQVFHQGIAIHSQDGYPLFHKMSIPAAPLPLSLTTQMHSQRCPCACSQSSAPLDSCPSATASALPGRLGHTEWHCIQRDFCEMMSSLETAKSSAVFHRHSSRKCGQQAEYWQQNSFPRAVLGAVFPPPAAEWVGVGPLFGLHIWMLLG